MRTAGLNDYLEVKRKASRRFEKNWEVVEDWTEQTRYETKIDRIKAIRIISAISSSRNGVLRWLKTYW